MRNTCKNCDHPKATHSAKTYTTRLPCDVAGCECFDFEERS